MKHYFERRNFMCWGFELVTQFAELFFGDRTTTVSSFCAYFWQKYELMSENFFLMM